MNAVTTTAKPMLLDFMSGKAGLKPQEYADTVRKTCGMVNATAEEFAAFLLVAREYNLNPLTKEIYAFPKKGGGIVPIVSIDGWVNLINSHPACNGFEFEVEHDDAGELVSITCRMYRKDRDRPVVVTEYYEECKRDTEPWKMKHRMLRHKSLIQTGRYAFGFSGIYDEDEGAKIAEMKDVTPAAPAASRVPPPAEVKKPAPAQTKAADPKPAESKAKPAGEKPAVQQQKPAEDEITDIDPVTGEIIENGDAVGAGDAGAAPGASDSQDTEEDTLGDFFERMDAAMSMAFSAADVEEVWGDYDVMSKFEDDEENQALGLSIKNRHLGRVKG